MSNLGIKTTKLEEIVQEFKDITATGVSKSIALDRIVAKHSDINSLFLRLKFHSCGWNY